MSEAKIIYGTNAVSEGLGGMSVKYQKVQWMFLVEVRRERFFGYPVQQTGMEGFQKVSKNGDVTPAIGRIFKTNFGCKYNN